MITRIFKISIKDNTQIILIDDEKHIRNACVQALELEGYNVVAFDNAKEILENITNDFSGVILTDIKMPHMDGLELMDKLLAIDPDFLVILMTGHGDIKMAVSAMRSGAYDFIEKPFSSDFMVDRIKRALGMRQLIMENRAMAVQLDGRSGLEVRIIGTSLIMQELRKLVKNVASTDADILILGETGTGKELIARNLHDLSERSKLPFVAINCGAMPESIFESELFGHEAGAFTGAQKQRIGKFEYANGGSLFLDEIEAMPLDLQVKLLRVLQERCLERLGSNKSIPLDIRIIAATKINLFDAINAGKFREDLYYRLNVVNIHIPPLRQRGNDIAELFRHFLVNAARRFKRTIPDIDTIKLNDIMSREWPGNIRELQNSADRYVLGLSNIKQLSNISDNLTNITLIRRMEEFEKNQIINELKYHKGSVKNTYEAFGIGRKTLYDKMKKYNISKDTYHR